MAFSGVVLRRLHGVWMVAAILLGAACWPAPASAKARVLDRSFCHAVTGIEASDDSVSSLGFSCGGAPVDYQQGSLWLRADIGQWPEARENPVLMVHHSRFDRLAVGFAYADGAVSWQEVRAGDYGSHWRAGGQIVFEAPERAVPVEAATLRFDRLAGHELVHARLLTGSASSMQAAGMAAAVGAALALLLGGCIYSLSLAIAVRRQYLAWQAAWAATLLFWGALWSQVHLVLAPGMAGTLSARICTFLACLAIAFATASAVTALDRSSVPVWMRRIALALGTIVGLAGIPLALMRGPELWQAGQFLGLAVLAGLLAVAICLGWGWRRGSIEARDFAAAWCLPMAVLGFIHVVDVESGFWGGGSKLAVLMAATWQALWLAAAATRRLAQLRIERDRAQELARSDPMTGLPNRRGFIESVTPMLERARADDLSAALLLVDVDRFKSINDDFGHEAGDAVLCRIAHRIARWQGRMCTVARLGGEEFGLLTVGMEGIVLDRFAESVRCELAACDHSESLADRRVTASVGVAEVRPACDFRELYRLADEALYEAKRAGRDRVVVKRYMETGRTPEVSERASDEGGTAAAAS